MNMPKVSQSCPPGHSDLIAAAAERSVTSTGRRAHGTRSVGAVIASCAGAGCAAVIASKHGSDIDAIAIFLSMHAWTAGELLCRWRLRWRIARLHEDIARTALERPDDEALRTLLVDVTSTRVDESDDRLPLRPQLIQKSTQENEKPRDLILKDSQIRSYRSGGVE
jgi:hypothetical protein